MFVWMLFVFCFLVVWLVWGGVLGFVGSGGDGVFCRLAWFVVLLGFLRVFGFLGGGGVGFLLFLCVFGVEM